MVLVVLSASSRELRVLAAVPSWAALRRGPTVALLDVDSHDDVCRVTKEGFRTSPPLRDPHDANGKPFDIERVIAVALPRPRFAPSCPHGEFGEVVVAGPMDLLDHSFNSVEREIVGTDKLPPIVGPYDGRLRRSPTALLRRVTDEGRPRVCRQIERHSPNHFKRLRAGGTRR